jgi:adenylate cyclase
MYDEGGTRPDPDTADLDRLLLGGRRRYTRAQVAQLSGMPANRFRQLWHALGFPAVAEDDVLFTSDDVAALRTLSELVDAGFVAPGTEASFARALAQPLARLADWQTTLLTDALARDRAGRPDQPGTPEAAPPAADALLSLLRGLQDYVWRRHLAAAAGRAPTAPTAGEERELAVGFADLVGYTTRTRGMSGAELGDMVEDFEATAAEVVARGGGRVVKTVGDGVLFTAADPAAAAEIGLSLPEQWGAAADRPPLRVGLAHGRVLTRLGDVYSSVVNLASRLTTVARAGSVLVDRELAARLRQHPRYRIEPLERRSVRGFDDLQPWLVSRRGADEGPLGPGAPVGGSADDVRDRSERRPG